jgi:hypothetical protein
LLLNGQDDPIANLATLGSLIVPILNRQFAHLGHVAPIKRIHLRLGRKPRILGIHYAGLLLGGRRNLCRGLFRNLCQSLFWGLCRGLFRDLCQSLFWGLYRGLFRDLCQSLFWGLCRGLFRDLCQGVFWSICRGHFQDLCQSLLRGICRGRFRDVCYSPLWNLHRRLVRVGLSVFYVPRHLLRGPRCLYLGHYLCHCLDCIHKRHYLLTEVALLSSENTKLGCPPSSTRQDGSRVSPWVFQHAIGQAVVTPLAASTATGKASLLPRPYWARRSKCTAIPRFSTGLQDP